MSRTLVERPPTRAAPTSQCLLAREELRGVVQVPTELEWLDSIGTTATV
ncbi:MAG: hypothetical protein AB1505_19460 [Candidatus Latescibacterota bacterium]